MRICLGMWIVYDVTHNMAKLEEYDIDGVRRKVLVHRKGATRAFPAGWHDVPADYQSVGQPVLIPGSMGTASYVLVGTLDSIKESFGSTAHGAGRVWSRARAVREYRNKDVQAILARRGILLRSATRKGALEEVPEAYKDVDEVVRTAEVVGISHMVARLRPVGVVKG